MTVAGGQAQTRLRLTHTLQANSRSIVKSVIGRIDYDISDQRNRRPRSTLRNQRVPCSLVGPCWRRMAVCYGLRQRKPGSAEPPPGSALVPARPHSDSIEAFGERQEDQSWCGQIDVRGDTICEELWR